MILFSDWEHSEKCCCSPGLLSWYTNTIILQMCLNTFSHYWSLCITELFALLTIFSSIELFETLLRQLLHFHRISGLFGQSNSPTYILRRDSFPASILPVNEILFNWNLKDLRKVCPDDIDGVGQFKAKLNIGKINDKNSAGGCFKKNIQNSIYLSHQIMNSFHSFMKSE